MTLPPKKPEMSDSQTYRLLCQVRQTCAPASGELADGDAAIQRKTLHAALRGSWLSIIEETFPYVERCVEEQRRFIQAHGEIVRVDQARKVDPESIRHLAQHSDFISRVDPEGDVLPKQLMIIQREDSFAIYENRFLFTLVQDLRRFLEARRQEYQRLEGCTETRIDWSRFLVDADSDLSVQLRHNLRESQEDVRTDDPAWQRLSRLRMSVEGLTLSPLMKLLTGVTPVSPPIVRTNVMKKNVNFQHALALYEELSKMEPPYFTENAEEPAAVADVPEELIGALDALARLQRRAVGLLPEAERVEAVQRQVEAEDQRTEDARREREEARKREVEARVEAARQQEIALRQQEAALWEARTAALTLERDGLIQALERERQENSQRMEALREEGLRETAALQAKLDALQGEKDAETERLAQEQAAHERSRAEAQTRLEKQKAEAEAGLAAQKAEAQAALLAEQKEARKQAEQMQKKHRAELDERKKRETITLRQRESAHQKELQQMRKTLEEQYALRQKSITQTHTRQRKNWEAKLERAQQRYAKKLLRQQKPGESKEE